LGRLGASLVFRRALLGRHKGAVTPHAPHIGALLRTLVSSNEANRPKLQKWLKVAPFGQPGIGGWVELQNLSVTVQK